MSRIDFSPIHAYSHNNYDHGDIFMDTETIPAGKFKAQCLKLMDEVGEGRRRAIIVTKHGKPMVKVTPMASDKKPKRLKAGFMKGSILYQGDIVSPMTELWNLPE